MRVEGLPGDEVEQLSIAAEKWPRREREGCDLADRIAGIRIAAGVSQTADGHDQSVAVPRNSNIGLRVEASGCREDRFEGARFPGCVQVQPDNPSHLDILRQKQV